MPLSSLELTPPGRIAVDPQSNPRAKRKAEFDLAIAGIAPFKTLYDTYKTKRLAEREVMKDVLREAKLENVDLDECVDTFTVNIKDLDLLRTIGGAETIVPLEQVLDEIPDVASARGTASSQQAAPAPAGAPEPITDFANICFFITPIGAEDSEPRKHSDLFMSSLIQPALKELNLNVIRADQIGEPGMITSQVIEYLKKSKLAVADLSYLSQTSFTRLHFVTRFACQSSK